MILKYAKSVMLGSKQVKKIYLGSKLVYTYMPAAPEVSEDTMAGDNQSSSYADGSTTWGDLTLSKGCTTSSDGVEIQNDQTYVSVNISGMSYPMTFEFKGRIDSGSYKLQANNPGMLFGMSPTQDSWGDGITCYSTTDYGIIIDTTGAMKITTQKTPTYVHIVLTVDNLGNLTMYMNGYSNKWTYSSDSGTRAAKNYIYNGQGYGRFTGAISIMRWWTSQLSSADIKKLFENDSSEYKS